MLPSAVNLLVKKREAEKGSKNLNQRDEARRENRTSLLETP